MPSRVITVLAKASGAMSARQIAAELGVERHLVNKELFRLLNEGLARKSSEPESKAPFWRATDSKPRRDLHRWQREALEAWEAHGCRGLLEAVTGSGKTRFAFEAVRLLEAKSKVHRTVVVVPTITLMDQWYEEALKFYDSGAASVGRRGDGHRDDFSIPGRRMLIATRNGASRYVDEILSFAKSNNSPTLLIADEVHRLLYAEQYGRVLDFPFTYTLGMSATLDTKEDARVGKLFFEFTFKDAIEAKIIPEFDLIQVRTALSASEGSYYERLTDQFSDLLVVLKARYVRELEGVDEANPDSSLLTRLGRIHRWSPDRDIERLFAVTFRRAAISHTCAAKIRLAQDLGKFFMQQSGRGKRIFFFERIESTEDVAAAVDEDTGIQTSFEQVAGEVQGENTGVWCETLQSKLKSTERRNILAGFRSSPAAVLLCCRMLDEGLNIPEIDVAVLVSSSQSKRQRVQRVGRALRKSRHGTRPLIISFFVAETTDANTIQHDKELFSAVARICQVNADGLLDKLKEFPQ